MKKAIFPLVVFLILVLGFQNCGYFSTNGEFLGASSCGESSASATLPAFQSGYHQFFISNTCNTCHKTGGLKGDSPFGDPDPSTAYDAFSRIGPDAIQTKLASGHQGYNIANLQAGLDSARDAYENAGGGNACADGANTTGGARVLFFENTPATDANGNSYLPVLASKLDILEEVEFNLGEPPFSPTLAGVTVKMEISVRYSDSPAVPRKPVGYSVQNIQMKSLEKRIHIQGINVLLNNNDRGVSTFQNVDSVVTPGDFWQPVSGPTTASYSLDSFSNNDLWQLQFLEIREE